MEGAMGRVGVGLGLGALVSALGFGCGGDSGASGGEGATSGGGILSASAGSEGAGEGSGEGSESAGSESEGSELGQTFCGDLDVSIVIDPAARVLDAASREALIGLLDQLVWKTGATVRVVLGAGTEAPPPSGCLEGLAAAQGRVLTYGAGGTVSPGAYGAMWCLLGELVTYQSDFDKGDQLFAGLLYPLLGQESAPNWPTPGATGLALLIGATDDQQNTMSARPGMASEAFLRLAAGGDRRRAAAFTYGEEADELELFALSFGTAEGSRSRYYDAAEVSFAAALKEWQAQAIGACDDFDQEAALAEPAGCERIDVLFVIDGSGSMTEEQAALAGGGGEPAVFAEFTDALAAELTSVEDFHVGVVSTELGSTRLHTHRYEPKEAPTPENACALAEQTRWIVGPTPGLAGSFACLGATRSGVDEFTALNAAQALHDPANAGFLRDDSLVFVVMISDEDTQDASKATQVAIRQQILAAVGDDLRRLVVLGIVGDQGIYEAPKTLCNGPYGTAAPGRRLSSIVRSFRERGLLQDLCAGSMAATFKAALGEVVSACEAFNPVP
jgi:hypothetical protein